MWLISEENNYAINSDKITEIYKDSDSMSIKCYISGSDYCIPLGVFKSKDTLDAEFNNVLSATVMPKNYPIYKVRGDV